MGKAVVHLSGTVDVWDTDEEDWAYSWAPSIGGRDVIAALEEAFPWRYPQPLPKVVAYLGRLVETTAALKRVLDGTRTWVEWDVLRDSWEYCQARGVRNPAELNVGALPDER